MVLTTVVAISLERDKSLERLTLHAYFLHLKLKILLFFYLQNIVCLQTELLKSKYFFDNSFIVKIYVQKTNFLKCHFFSIGDTAVFD